MVKCCISFVSHKKKCLYFIEYILEPFYHVQEPATEYELMLTTKLLFVVVREALPGPVSLAF